MTSHDQAAGATIGGVLGFIKSLSIITALTWITVYETAVLAAVGAAIGFLVTAVLKYLKKTFLE